MTWEFKTSAPMLKAFRAFTSNLPSETTAVFMRRSDFEEVFDTDSTGASFRNATIDGYDIIVVGDGELGVQRFLPVFKEWKNMLVARREERDLIHKVHKFMRDVMTTEMLDKADQARKERRL